MTIICLVAAAVLVGIDQLIKILVINNMDLYQSISVIKFGNYKVFNLTYILNDGAGWSLFSGKKYFLIIITFIFLVGIIIYLLKFAKKSRFLCTALTLIIAGGFGNLIDRVFRNGNVIDYIETKFMKFPIFNFADISVVIGGILFFIYILFLDNSDMKKDNVKKLSEGETNE